MHVFHHRHIENRYNFFAIRVFYKNFSEVVSTKILTGSSKNTTSLNLSTIFMWISWLLSEVVSTKMLTGSWKDTTSLNFDAISIWFSCCLSEVVFAKPFTGSWFVVGDLGNAPKLLTTKPVHLQIFNFLIRSAQKRFLLTGQVASAKARGSDAGSRRFARAAPPAK